MDLDSNDSQQLKKQTINDARACHLEKVDIDLLQRCTYCEAL